ncbi:MAG: MFS transporter [Betaproteobacteria bacterium]|nr:MFS transporter [Betaproteobacteria bacterium]
MAHSTGLAGDAALQPPHTAQARTAFGILSAISLSHFLNDVMQSLLLALYPLFKHEFSLSFVQVGLITMTFQLTASMLQPLVGYVTDRRPMPWSLPAGMASTFAGLLTLSMAHDFPAVLAAAALVGMGSAIFHPESSRVARMASGGQHGLAQSIFQVGGNAGAAAGPLVAAWLVLPHGQGSIAWVSLAALAGMVILAVVGRWYRQQHRQSRRSATATQTPLSRRETVITLGVLVMLMFSKFFYLASINNYLMFFLMHQFGITSQTAQYHLFGFLASVALGTLLGGPIGDRIGRRRVIWISILGIAPFTLALPYAGLSGSLALSMISGFMLASAFPAMVVYAQELIPGRIGTVSGMFFGLAFGLAGIGAALLGIIADHWGIVTLYRICSFLPLLGLLAVFLPDLHRRLTS